MALGRAACVRAQPLALAGGSAAQLRGDAVGELVADALELASVEQPRAGLRGGRAAAARGSRRGKARGQRARPSSRSSRAIWSRRSRRAARSSSAARRRRELRGSALASATASQAACSPEPRQLRPRRRASDILFACRATTRRTPAACSSAAGRARRRCATARRPSAAARAAGAPTRARRRRARARDARSCSAPGARSRSAGCGSARRSTTGPDSVFLGITVAFFGLLGSLIADAGARHAARPPLAAAAPRRRATTSARACSGASSWSRRSSPRSRFTFWLVLLEGRRPRSRRADARASATTTGSSRR